MIAARILIADTPPPTSGDPSAEDAYNEAVNVEIVEKARAVSDGAMSVRVEIARPGEDWDVSGDAVEVTFSDPPTIATLPPYSEVAP